jgi:hypothetical protein
VRAPLRRSITAATIAAAAATGLTALAGHAEAAPADTIYGVTSANQLISFRSTAPGTLTSSVPINNVDGNVLAIDFAPSTGQLYAVTTTTKLYAINPANGRGTLMGTGAFADPAVWGAAAGIDLQPVVDRLRVISGTNSMRIHPNTGAVSGTDTSLTLAGSPEPLADVAYANNVAGATVTTLFGIDTTNDVLVRVGGPDGVPSPNGGLVTAIGPLGVNALGTNVGFDISGVTNTAWASLQSAGATRLYKVNLTTGAATGAWKIGTGIDVIDLAVDPDPAPGLNQVLLVDGPSAIPFSKLIKKGVPLRYSCAEACGTTLTLKSGSTTLGTASTSLGARGIRAVTLKLTTKGKAVLKKKFASQSVTSVPLTISGSATDSDGGNTGRDGITIKATR